MDGGGSSEIRNDGGSNEMPVHAGASFVNVDFILDVWRAELGSEARNRIVNKIVETLRRYVQASQRVLPISELDLSWELMRMAVKFEEKMFIIAESKDDYLHRICMKMVVMDLKIRSASATNQIPLETVNNLNSSN